MSGNSFNVFATVDGAKSQTDNYSGMSNAGRDAQQSMGGMDPMQIIQQVMQLLMGILKMSG